MSQSSVPTVRAAQRVLAVTLLAAGLSLLGGCSSLEFYRQAIAGQWQIWRQQQPIDAMLADPATPAALRAKLEYVSRAREFAARTLHLPADGSYHEYVDLGRGYVVWNVFAAPELSLDAHQSCFLLIGCLSYRGFFAAADAERYAATLRAAGMDVHVAGIAAYSTLGWFDDPVLSSILAWDNVRRPDAATASAKLSLNVVSFLT